MPIPTKPTKQYICSKCSTSFQSFAVMQQHETHCTGTKTFAELESHRIESHALKPTEESKNQEDKNVWTCDRCNKKISINDKYDEQQKARHFFQCQQKRRMMNNIRLNNVERRRPASVRADNQSFMYLIVLCMVGGLGLIVYGSLNLTVQATPPPSMYNGVRCIVQEFLMYDGVRKNIPIRRNKELTAFQPQFNTAIQDNSKILPLKDGSNVNLVCETKVRVVYPSHIFEQKRTTTTKTLSNGYIQTSYLSGPVPTGFEPMPLNNSLQTMFSVGSIFHQKGSTPDDHCWLLQFNGAFDKNEDTVEVECSIFNQTAVVTIEEIMDGIQGISNTADQILLFSGISEGYSNAGYAYSEHIYYTNQGYRNFYAFLMLLLGCFLFLVFSFVPFLRCISKLCVRFNSDSSWFNRNQSGAKGMTELSNI